MPKSTKRDEARRAERIRRAHATEPPRVEVKEDPRRRAPGQKPPARGLTRYPWAITLILLLIIGSGVYTMFSLRVGPFAPGPSPTPKAVSESPCIKEDVLTQITDTTPAPSAEEIQSINHTFEKAPEMQIKQDKLYCAGINTTQGLIVVELDPKLAPNTVNNFVYLAQNKYYDGLTFHRVLEGTIIQGGDPKGDGTGGPGYAFNDEQINGEYEEGTIAMANSGPNTNGSQFFINLKDNKQTFEKKYNLFGRVVQGLDVAKKMKVPPEGNPTDADAMTHVKVVEAP